MNPMKFRLLNPALGDIKGILRMDIFKLPESFILLQWIKLLRKEEQKR